MHFPVSHTLTTAPRLVLWAAHKAHRAIRCAVLPSASPNFDPLVTKWLGELRGFLLSDVLRALRPSIQQFFDSLMHYSQEGTSPPQAH